MGNDNFIFLNGSVRQHQGRRDKTARCQDPGCQAAWWHSQTRQISNPCRPPAPAVRLSGKGQFLFPSAWAVGQQMLKELHVSTFLSFLGNLTDKGQCHIQKVLQTLLSKCMPWTFGRRVLACSWLAVWFYQAQSLNCASASRRFPGRSGKLIKLGYYLFPYQSIYLPTILTAFLPTFFCWVLKEPGFRNKCIPFLPDFPPPGSVKALFLHRSLLSHLQGSSPSLSEHSQLPGKPKSPRHQKSFL